MSDRLPPLNAIRAFEAAARLHGFQNAGEELHVSAGAVAHQIKQLEAWLGVPLFHRLPRGVALSTAGKQYAQAIKPLLDGLVDASDSVRRLGNERVVTVTAVPTFVTRWLMPRLGRLQQEHPEIDMRVLASLDPTDFLRDGIDVAIRMGTGPYPGLKADVLLEEWFTPVCSSSFQAGIGDIATPADLLRCTLLHEEAFFAIPEEINWPRWFAAQGIAYEGNTRPSFSHTYLAIEAALNGQGIALAPEAFVSQDVRAGRLVRLLPQAVRSPYRFHLLRLPDAETRPAVKAFCEWVMAEVASQDKQEPH
jgi:LysR family glycine cleavage system transcriptional activator